MVSWSYNHCHIHQWRVSFQFWNNQLSSGIKYQRKAYLIVYSSWQWTNKLTFIKTFQNTAGLIWCVQYAVQTFDKCISFVEKQVWPDHVMCFRECFCNARIFAKNSPVILQNEPIWRISHTALLLLLTFSCFFWHSIAHIAHLRHFCTLHSSQVMLWGLQRAMSGYLVFVALQGNQVSSGSPTSLITSHNVCVLIFHIWTFLKCFKCSNVFFLFLNILLPIIDVPKLEQYTLYLPL